MYRLMADFYKNVQQADFERDLAEKEWVIVSRDPQRRVRGFTTLSRLTVRIDGQPVVALFSGDTVLDPDSWGAGGWARAWGHHAGTLMRDMQGAPLYWLLLTATHRTYRFLPTFLQDFYPRPGVETPVEFRKKMDALAAAKFPTEYDPASGIVRTRRPLSVRSNYVDMATQGLDDEHGEFFAARNPGFLDGDYLVCIGDLSAPNQTRLGRRFFRIDSQ